MTRNGPAPGLEPILAGWAEHQRRLLAVIAPLGSDHLALRPAADHWAVWQLASNMAGARAYWFHEILGEGDSSVREQFRVQSTTLPGLSLADAGWEDDEDHPRSAQELVGAFESTWRTVDACLRRWIADDLVVEFSRERRGRTEHFTRGWVIWHLIEHELQHGTEIAVILRANGLPTLDL